MIKLHFVSIMVVIFHFTGIPSAADSKWVPSEGSLNAFDAGQVCRIYRSLVTRTSKKLNESKRAVEIFNEDLRIKRLELETCAIRQKIEGENGFKSEVLLAELCPEHYASWLHPGVLLKVHQEELLESERALSEVSFRLKTECTKFPGDVALAY